MIGIAGDMIICGEKDDYLKMHAISTSVTKPIYASIDDIQGAT